MNWHKQDKDKVMVLTYLDYNILSANSNDPRIFPKDRLSRKTNLITQKMIKNEQERIRFHRLDDEIIQTLSPCDFSMTSIHKPVYDEQLQTVRNENESNAMSVHRSIKKIIKKLKSNDVFKEAWRESYKPNLGEIHRRQPNKIEFANIHRSRKKSLINVKNTETKREKENSVIQVKNLPESIHSNVHNNINVRSTLATKGEKSTLFQNIKARNK